MGQRIQPLSDSSIFVFRHSSEPPRNKLHFVRAAAKTPMRTSCKDKATSVSQPDGISLRIPIRIVFMCYDFGTGATVEHSSSECSFVRRQCLSSVGFFSVFLLFVRKQNKRSSSPSSNLLQRSTTLPRRNMFVVLVKRKGAFRRRRPRQRRPYTKRYTTVTDHNGLHF